MKYAIMEAADTVKDSKIEKLGVVVTFTMREVEAHEAMLRKLQKELQAKLDFEQAKMFNVERNHSFVKDMSPQDLFTAHMYQDARANSTAARDKLTEVEKQLSDYENEKIEIVKQIPELANVESPMQRKDLEDNKQA